MTRKKGFGIIFTMLNVRIYPRSRSTMQSGQSGKVGLWVLEGERPSSQSPEALMGWTQTGDTMNQIKLSFETCKEAEAFATDQGWRYTITQQNKRHIKPRNYGDNFVYKE